MPADRNALYDGAGMGTLDHWAIEQMGVDGLVLMESAGAALADGISALCPDGPVAVVCGPGNNGGDGYVAARLLREGGREVIVLTTVDPGQLQGDAKVNAERLPGAPPVTFSAAGLERAAIVVDALLGTGSAGPPRGLVADAVGAINALRVPVISADIPTGVDAATGAVDGVSVNADATVTFAAAKLGLFVTPGKQAAGTVTVAELPYPPRWPIEPVARLLSRTELIAGMPRRSSTSNKFTSGHVVVAGGSRGLSGAVCLSAEAAARAGAGYVTACVPERLADVVEAHLAEVMTPVLPGPGSHHGSAAVPAVVELTQRHPGALVIGPGLGTGPDQSAFVHDLLAACPSPVVIDADGLTAFAGEPAAIARAAAQTLLTPHAGELARLLGTDTAAVMDRRLEHALRAAELTAAVVVLKGDDTLVVDPEGSVAVSRGDAPGLATAGTGDVLAGICGAMLAKGMPVRGAAELAVAVHAEAGRLAADAVGSADGVVAGDVIAAIPRALRPGHDA